MDKPVFARLGSVLRLPPGFRFRPTDEELVDQYLKRKINSCPLPASIIPEIINLRNYDPWDLPGGCKEVKYFFSLRDVKHLSHGRSSRAARSGYWKSEGKEKQVMASSRCNQVVGMKKVLVFYRGKPQTRTDWIMHEYHLVPQRNHSTHNSVVPKDDWVVCRIFRRKRTAKMENDDEHGGIINENTNLKDLVRVRNRNLGPSLSSSSMDSSCVTELSDGSSEGQEANSART
ncbi:NAC domain-containing protein 83-like [Curcuma longa]|uniref:NAC domain-containing protein 83-like n=1 Tax=Curcuma longa TaxID=136217 RepID=UPI003D9F0058